MEKPLEVCCNVADAWIIAQSSVSQVSIVTDHEPGKPEKLRIVLDRPHKRHERSRNDVPHYGPGTMKT